MLYGLFFEFFKTLEVTSAESEEVSASLNQCITMHDSMDFKKNDAVMASHRYLKQKLGSERNSC